MKKNLHVLVFLFSLILSISSLIAQQKEDTVYLLDGGQKKGKVLTIGDEIVKFNYTGEELQYELKKSLIEKIVFGNGRVELFKETNTASNAGNTTTGQMNSVSNGNKLAIVPFEIASNDQGLTTDVMRREIQQACAEALRSRSLSFQIQDPRTTNATLAKSNINIADIANHTPEELAKLLGVDYIILGVYEILRIKEHPVSDQDLLHITIRRKMIKARAAYTSPIIPTQLQFMTQRS
ncbi:hypothetical protein [Sphingobacterium sp. UBA6320]|uniref:hypothetical protein n=1 Tax=Sphingobacterium sp. UBA6320 TaxID=1947510 RepID=UPI0025EBA5E8|nr:hypothetical protein [Sphingobacterium sp. UBA6320]